MLKSLPSCILLVNRPRDPLLTLKKFRCDSYDSGSVFAAISASKEISGVLFSSTSGVGKVSPCGVLSLGLSSGRWPTDNRNVHTGQLST